jgi:hypothetical protein
MNVIYINQAGLTPLLPLREQCHSTPAPKTESKISSQLSTNLHGKLSKGHTPELTSGLRLELKANNPHHDAWRMQKHEQKKSSFAKNDHENSHAAHKQQPNQNLKSHHTKHADKHHHPKDKSS